jgi:hypothetical protein
MRILLTVIVLAIFAGPAAGEGMNRSGLLVAEVVKYEEQQSVLTFNVGGNDVAVGDRFWVAGVGETIGAGKILFVADGESFGRLADPAVKVAPGAKVTLFRERAAAEYRDRLGKWVTIKGHVLRGSPWQKMAWLDIGSRAGLKLTNTVLIRRKGIPIARGRVKILEKDKSLTDLVPLVGNALARTGDAAELWPAPCFRRWGMVNSAVLEVEDHPEGALVTMVGNASDGLVKGRLVDLFRDGGYVGVAAVTETSGLLSYARMIEAASFTKPAEGDTALVRPPPKLKDVPLSAAVFRVEGDYSLLAAGETDGIRVEDKFIVRRQDINDAATWHYVAELTVKTTKVDYSGANIRLINPDAHKLELWDMAERRGPGLHNYRTIGIVEQVEADNRWAVGGVEAGSDIKPGTIIRCVSDKNQPCAGAVVIRHMTDRVILHIPPGWGAMKDLLHARLEVVENWRPPSTAPVTGMGLFGTAD